MRCCLWLVLFCFLVGCGAANEGPREPAPPYTPPKDAGKQQPPPRDRKPGFG